MKIKSIKRFPLKLALFLPLTREILMKLFISGSHSFREKLWNLISNKPPIFFRYNNQYKVHTGGNFGYLVSLKTSSYEADWHRIFSIGHDIEVKKYYFSRILNKCPSQFIDIGANYGMHSLIFLSHGISTTYIEPNSECISEFKSLCQLNDFNPEILSFGLGKNSSSLILSWPKNKTWLGQVKIKSSNLKIPKGYDTQEVLVKTLDTINVIKDENALIKIDAEGYEFSILEGGREVIIKYHPEIIFESIPGETSRSLIHNFFFEVEYRIFDLLSEKNLDKDNFCSSPSKNFLAKYIKA